MVAALGLGGLLSFTLLRNKDARYIMPILISLSLFVGLAVSSLRYRRNRLIAWGIVGVCILSMLSTSFMRSSQRIYLHSTLSLVVWSNEGYITGAPAKEQWCLEEAMAEIKKHPGSVAYSVSDTIWFNNWALQYYFARDGITLQPADRADLLLQRSAVVSDTNIWRCEMADGSIVSLSKNLARYLEK